jgi:pimeloyl-CoA dehydrogenase small subunit
MDFDLTEEQQLLKDSVGRLMADRYGFRDRSAHATGERGWSAGMWQQYADLGLLGLAFDERHGGVGGGPIETMIVMEAFGRALILEPYVAAVLLGGDLVRRAGSEAQQADYLPRIADGTLRPAFAHTERQSRFDLADVATTARRDGDGWRVNGEKAVVLHGDSADLLIVSARTGGDRRDRAGIGLFVVDPASPGVARTGYPTHDMQRAATVTLADVPATALGDPGDGLPAIEATVDRAAAALCAEAVGIMDDLHAMTVEYLKTRTQFGVPIGDFQALQHRAVDMYVAIEQARSMAMYAAMIADAGDPAARRAAMSAAKVQVARSARFVGQQAVQLHGGIGMTMEYKAGHGVKRLIVIETLFGDADHHLALLADAGSLLDA